MTTAAQLRRDRTAVLHLLPSCQVVVHRRVVPVSPRAQRLLGVLALARGAVRRAVAAGTLWPEVTDARAFSSLRSTLRELPRGPALVATDGDTLRLAPLVRVDWVAATRLAHRVVTGREVPVAPDRLLRLLRHDLLPHWSEPWLEAEQEAFRQLRLHSLEVLCDRLSGQGRHAVAVEAGLLAVAGDPLRESAHRALVAAHLAEGNLSEARAQYRRYERLLDEELGVPPGPALRALVEPWAVAVVTPRDRLVATSAREALRVLA